MISGGAFAIAALSAIIGFYMLVSFYSSHKMGLPTIIIAQIIVVNLAIMCELIFSGTVPFLGPFL